ncbi:MAG: hypothetical protein QHH19_04095 [Candidatus Thermoplasmatota archaeon]|nr:hypothetical protein [Candidatus Thermoplasmatota archaeon]
MRDLTKDDNIHIKLEINKDKNTNQLIITTRFDPSASNFLKDEYGYIWIPTPEEIKFMNDAFELIPTEKTKAIPQEKKVTKTVEKIEEKVQTYKPQVKPEETSPFERKPVAYTEKKEEETVFEVTGEATEENPNKPTKEQQGNSVIVKADEKAIERALKKDIDEDDSIREVDEQTIIDKVLSQKKKGKWSRPAK